jgi:hypothetical protein
MRTVRVSMPQTLHGAAAARKIGRNRIQSTRAEFPRVTFLSVRGTERRRESRTMIKHKISKAEGKSLIEAASHDSGTAKALGAILAALAEMDVYGALSAWKIAEQAAKSADILDASGAVVEGW